MNWILSFLLALFGLAVSTVKAQTTVRSVMTDRNTVLKGQFTNLFTANVPELARAAVVKVGSMSELRDLDTDMPSGALVEVAGYYGPGDGGGGLYVLTNSVSGTNLYGGRVLALGGAKSWEMLGQPRAEQFGAVGDGVADDASALNQGISWAASKLQTLLAAKTYLASVPIQLPSNTSVDGDSTGVIKRAWTLANRGALQNFPLNPFGSYTQANNVVVTTTNITLRNLAVENANPSLYYNGNLLTLWGASNVLIVNCTFGGPGKGLTNNWITSIWADDVTVDSSKFENGPGVFCDGFHFVGGRRLKVSNSTMIGGDDALALLQVYDQTISDVVVTGCFLRSYNAHAIRIGRDSLVTPSLQTNWVEKIVVANCVGDFGMRNGGIFVEDKATSGTNYTKLIRDVLVEGVTLSMNPAFDSLGVTNGYSMRIQGGSNVVVKNVVITDAINPAEVNYTLQFTADGLKLRNSQFQTLFVTGVNRLYLSNLDLENARANSLLQIAGTDLAVVNGGNFISSIGTGIAYSNPSGVFSVYGANITSGGTGIALTSNPSSLSVFGSKISPGTLAYAGGVYPASAAVLGNTGIADVVTKSSSLIVNGPTVFTGTMTQNTPDFNPVAIYNRQDLGTTMQFGFNAGFPTWDTTNANWFQWLSGLGTYGRNTSSDSTAKSYIGVAVQHYANSQGVVQGVRARSGASRNNLDIGFGSSFAKAMTDVSIGVAPDTTTSTGTEILRARLTGIAINTGGIAADPVRPLDVVSTSQGWLSPRLTTSQGDAISSPVAGEQWYDSTVNRTRFYNGTRNYYGTPSLFGATTQDPASVAANSTLDLTDVTGITGARAGDLVFVADPGSSNTLLFKGWVPSNDTVRIRLVNAGTSPVDLGANTFRFIVVPQ